MHFLQQESKQTFPENLKIKKRDYHFQTEVVRNPGDFFVHLCGNDSFAKSRKIEFSSKFLEFLRKFWPDDVIVTI